GFAHGFLVLSDEAQFQYKVDNIYAPEAECTLRFDDPELGIPWPINRNDMILSAKDLKGLSLKDLGLSGIRE
ncbi:MAG: dTDP-4-dehydrorhamnose 3,5-epimerase, partial [Muribaculaceae bacterium]|nr:dTDP-4-dehydrorhamnose 3,5-epimerase [Muribaculaceae bacterium]